MFSKLKQIKELRSQAKQLQSKLSEETVQADALGGKVSLVMDGNQKILSLDIDKELLTPENKEKLENALKDAFESATKKIQQMMAQKMRKGDLKMPDLPQL